MDWKMYQIHYDPIHDGYQVLRYAGYDDAYSDIGEGIFSSKSDAEDFLQLYIRRHERAKNEVYFYNPQGKRDDQIS